jgi:hypothetical protein
MIVWTDTDICDNCGHPKALHPTIDSIDDGFSVTGTVELCDECEDCPGFWS